MTDWCELRRQAANRRRRVIFNNDGDDVFQAKEATPEAFLAVRCEGIQGTHVDTYAYSTLSNFNSCVHNSRVAEVNAAQEPFLFARNNLPGLIAKGYDSLSLVTGFCRKHNIEPFWSCRMNDVHDNWYPLSWTTLKRNRPDLRLWREGDYGRPGDGQVEPSMYFTAMDYGQEEVRDVIYGTIADVIERYDVDGVELDFLRNPMYFRPNMEGRPVEQEHLETMTQFVRQIRRKADEVGHRKGRPLLVSARVPNLLSRCSYIGLDVERWMREKLIDFVLPSIEFCPFTGDVKEMTDLAHCHGMPSYPCISGSVYTLGWPAAILNALAGGADGISTFNDFDPLDAAWRIAGDPAKMKQVDRMYQIDVFDSIVRMHEHVMELSNGLPFALASAAYTEVTLPVGEDLSVRSTDTDLTLSIVLDGCAAGDGYEFAINGRPLTYAIEWLTDGMAPQAVGKTAFLAKVDHGAVLEGANKVGVKVTPICNRESPAVIQQLKLSVKMKK